jgi:hypothetical protein
VRPPALEPLDTDTPPLPPDADAPDFDNWNSPPLRLVVQLGRRWLMKGVLPVFLDLPYAITYIHPP